jgi:hypothetical protein
MFSNIPQGYHLHVDRHNSTVNTMNSMTSSADGFISGLMPQTAVSLWEREDDVVGGSRSGSMQGRVFTVEEARRNAQTMVRNA